ncbi:uncharacterized protein ofcc1 [Heterodontus francisci]|uniref:uncharacterized protein ofcc1 n=1 Tax=Heterodontus francisci TaxID=7792 RepID=UPI00355B6363
MEEEKKYEQKFQQKARKQTKQKKSKSAEFLMVKDNRSAAEGIENPAFNISTKNLSAYHNSAGKEIRHDRHDGTLAAHQQKLLLQTYDQARGNEYSRNYFDLQMYEGIDPRQYRIEVSTEDECELTPDKNDDMDFYLKLLKLLEDEEGNHDDSIPEATGACVGRESAGDRSNILGLRQEVESEMIPPYVEQFEESIQDDVILVDSLSLEQARDQRQGFLNAHMGCRSQEKHLVQLEKLSVKTQEEEAKQRVMAFVRKNTKETKPQEAINSEQSEILQESLHVAFQNAESQLLKALENRRGEVMAMYGDLTEVKHQYSGMQGHRWKVEWSGTPQPVQIQLKCLRAVKDKLPKGQFILRISLHSWLGGHPLRWSNSKDQDCTGTTLPVYHDGNFYNIELSFNQSIAAVLPSEDDVQPEMALIFELFLLHGINSSIDWAVGWGAFPICNSKLEILEGKYKCPLLRGHRDTKIDEFRKIEDLISSDIDHWLCNLYFQVIKLPKSLVGQKQYVVDLQLPPHFLSSPECCYASEKNETNENILGTNSDRKVFTVFKAGFDVFNKLKRVTFCEISNASQPFIVESAPSPKLEEDSNEIKQKIPLWLNMHKFKNYFSMQTTTRLRKAVDHNLLEINTKDTCQSPAEKNSFPQVPWYLADHDQYRFSVVKKVQIFFDVFFYVEPAANMTTTCLDPHDPRNQCPPWGQRTSWVKVSWQMSCSSLQPGFVRLKLLEVTDHKPFKSPCLSRRVPSTSYGQPSGGALHGNTRPVYRFETWHNSIRKLGLIMLLVALIWFMRLYLHYCSQWLYLQAIGIPINKFHFYPHTVELSYQNSLLHTREELTIVALGPLTLNVAMLIMAMIKWVCHVRFGSFPSFLSRLIMAMGLWAVLDPLAIFIVDGILGRLAYSTDSPIADAAKLYWLFYRMEHSGIPGILITVILYIVMFVSSLTILYFYFLRLRNGGRLQDVFYRLHSAEERFLVPMDLELSNQELNYIMKKAEQWRGINGERRKVAVYDYIWNDELTAHPSCSCGPQEHNQTSGSEAGCREITTHVSIYIIHISGLQELYRHFLRLPDGAIVEEIQKCRCHENVLF